ncbi:MAG: hypothetical protein ABSA93_21655 [Streptosporangiaceae bacterium]|jgi:hypothetical protein
MKLPHLRILTVLAASTLVVAVGLGTAAASAAVTAPSHTATAAATSSSPGQLISTVTGTFTNSDGEGTFTGTFTPRKFSVVDGVLEATGVLKGTLTDADGTQIGTVDQTVTDSVNTGATNAATNVCSILNLTLGPLNLNLLGLVVTLNQVHLTITAVPGVGNLLGNLLCDITNLLNSGGSLSTISALLNAVLAALGL